MRKLDVKEAYLEKRFKILPAGVVSKKFIGERKMANAIRSCSLRLACKDGVSHRNTKPACIAMHGMAGGPVPQPNSPQ